MEGCGSISKGSFQTCNAGRAGAQPYHVTHADTPIRSFTRRPADSFFTRRHAHPPTRRYVLHPAFRLSNESSVALSPRLRCCG